MRALLFLLVVGCSGDPEGEPGEQAAPVCEAGKVSACPCPGSSDGTQRCAGDGSRWGECECRPTDDPCTSDDECPSGEGCDPDGTCVPKGQTGDECTSDAGCVSPLRCNANGSCTDFEFGELCDSPAECPFGERCTSNCMRCDALPCEHPVCC